MTNLHVKQITPSIGAEISGIDLSIELPTQALDFLYEHLIKHHVIVLRGQSITPQQHLALAQSFGQPEPKHPTYPHVEDFENIVVLHNHKDNPPDTDGWHTDVTFRDEPPFASILIGRTIPDIGGDTLWCSLCRAYDTLPENIKAELADKYAVHDMGDFRNNFSVGESSGQKVIDAHQKFGSAIHPIVQTHPASGRKFLFVNESFTQHIVNMRATDSNSLLGYLFHHINQPENQMRLQWQPDTLVMWDNRCTWHYATADYLPAERLMHRITVTRDARIVKP